MSRMTPREGNARPPVPLTHADPVDATPEAAPARAQRVLPALGLVAVGALLAVGAMQGVPMLQGTRNTPLSTTPGVRDMQPAEPPVTTRETHTVRLTEPQMQRITLATVSL